MAALLTLSVYGLTELPISGNGSNAPTRVVITVTFPMGDTPVTWPKVVILTVAQELGAVPAADFEHVSFY